ncbi:MAG: sugar ABC transporter substrate-binding protein [Roseateles depolymerans]|uniref:Sugar ABC transporter substrate-binding protein n=1 Tax=Roseateles depolymerans TaxID=76731 RepID=A0A2W5DHW7_9BURK|nr:MAG: sugar ABC transporter substrate-binding protein [Roseateles depolymerans]
MSNATSPPVIGLCRRSLLLAPLALAGAAHALPAAQPLTLASFPDLDRAAKAEQAAWDRAHPGTPLRIVSRNYADHHNAMSAVLATGSGQPDVMALDLRFIGKFAAGGGLEDLLQSPYDAGPLLAGLPAFSVTQGRSPKGALVAMPTDIGPGTLLYRQDLLQRAGLQEGDLTASWPGFIAAGRELKRATGAALLTDAAELRDILLRVGLQDGEGIYFGRQGEVLVGNERFQRAFELGLAVRRAGLDLKAPSWTNEWGAAFRQGRVATQMMGCWLAGHLKNWLAPEQAGLWRSAPLPGGLVASYGGSFYAIPRNAPNKAAAWAFIRQMVFDRATQLQSLRVLDAFPALLSAQDDAVMEEPIPYLGGQRARLLWRDIARRVPATPVHKHDSLATAVVRSAFEDVVSQNRPIPEALAEARDLVIRRARR